MSATQEFKIKKALSNAKKLSIQGHITEAINIYNSILQQQPHNSAAKKNLSKLKKKLPVDKDKNAIDSNPSQQQVNALVSLYNSGRMQETEHTAKNLLNTYPGSALLNNIFGAAMLEQGKLQESLNVFEKTIALKPDYAVTHGNLGIVLYRLGQFKKALKCYDRAIELNPDDPIVYVNRGNVFVDLGQRKEASEDFQKAQYLKPDYIEAYYGYANVLYDLGKFEESLANYDKCINLKPDYVEAHVNRGNTLKDLGRREEAIVSYQKAIQLKPGMAIASINLGNILTSQGKFQEAVELTAALLEKEPNNRELMSCLVTALNYCSLEAALNSTHAKLQNRLRKIVPADIETPNITNELVQKLYLQCHSELATSGLHFNNYSATQIWRGKANYQACDRHFVVFNKFNAIPKYCFSCYKVFVEPRTVVELFKLLIVFDSIKLPGDATRKCMVEIRPEISGAYKGYIYCQNLEEGKEIMRRVREVVSERISNEVQVKLKRGCSEYSLSYPEFAQNDENGNSVMNYKNEWREHEDYTDKNLVKSIYPPVLDSYNHSGLTLSDTLVMRNWLAYAATIGDLSYMEISGAPVEKLQIGNRQGSS